MNDTTNNAPDEIERIAQLQEEYRLKLDQLHAEFSGKIQLFAIGQQRRFEDLLIELSRSIEQAKKGGER